MIKKEILLEHYVSREHSLIPYYGQDLSKRLSFSDYQHNDNWGEYPYDIDLNKCEIFTYDDITVEPMRLSVYFDNMTIIPFRVLMDKAVIFNDILRNTSYYKVITKKGVKQLVPYNITISEKSLFDIFDSFDIANDNLLEMNNGDIIGVCHGYENVFNECGGNEMLVFLSKAMGKFIVPKQYIKNENGVPEIMYYSQVENYCERMSQLKSYPDCCNATQYDFLGGDKFYSFLSSMYNKIPSEIEYWQKAIYTEGNTPVSPHINMSVLLTEDYHNIGQFLPASTNSVSMVVRNGVKECFNRSLLSTLRNPKVNYAELYDSELNAYVEVEFPMVLREIYDEDDNFLYYKLIEPYEVNCPFNVSETVNGELYGDMIYRMDFKENGELDIYYVIGGKLIKDINGYHYNDARLSQDFNFKTYIKKFEPTRLSVDDYFLLKEELKNTANYDADIVFKGEITTTNEIIFPEEDDLFWVFRVNSFIEYNNEFLGEFIVVNNKKQLLNIDAATIENEEFSGIRYFERKRWKSFDFSKFNSGYRIKQLFDGYLTEINILEYEEIVVNTKNGRIIDMMDNETNIKCLYFSKTEEALSDHYIMMEYDFGNVETIFKNVDEVAIDRGYVSTFETHYKLGEVNSLEDMENYQNNFFGLK